jgi:hypothetical protein
MKQAGDAEWRADPAGRHQYRLWDGGRWTDWVADNGQVAFEPYGGTAPRRAMMHPAAEEQRPRRKLLWVVPIVAVLFIVGLVALALTLQDDVDELTATQQQHAIAKPQFDAVQLRISPADLIRQVHKTPENAQHYVTRGLVDTAEINSSCVYYNWVGKKFGVSRFQFCFEANVLTSKDAY